MRGQEGGCGETERGSPGKDSLRIRRRRGLIARCKGKEAAHSVTGAEDRDGMVTEGDDVAPVHAPSEKSGDVRLHVPAGHRDAPQEKKAPLLGPGSRDEPAEDALAFLALRTGPYPRHDASLRHVAGAGQVRIDRDIFTDGALFHHHFDLLPRREKWKRRLFQHLLLRLDALFPQPESLRPRRPCQDLARDSGKPLGHGKGLEEHALGGAALRGDACRGDERDRVRLLAREPAEGTVDRACIDAGSAPSSR